MEAPVSQPEAVTATDVPFPLAGLDAKAAQAMEKINHIDFNLLKAKLGMQKGWSDEFVDEIERRYRMFLALRMMYPESRLTPSLTIDEFWHAHILDTRAYFADCDRLFGQYVHHFPYSGLLGPFSFVMAEVTKKETVRLFMEHFGVQPFEGPYARLPKPVSEEADAHEEPTDGA